MQPEADFAGPQRQQLHAALLEYARSPGKYQVVLRQPPLLFAMLRDVLQIAAGRDTDGAAEAGVQPAQLQEAACFFARNALLYPGADHYALLGLDRTASTAEMKDRYRLLMRLLHPDFATLGSATWPADAATRINRAYEVLSSPAQRQEYDELFAPASARQSTGKHRATRSGASSHRPAGSGIGRSGLKKLVTVCAVAGAVAIVAIFFAGGSEPVQLVQRTGPTAIGTQPIRVAVQENQVNLPVPLAAATGGPSLAGSVPEAPTPHTAPLKLSMTAELTGPPVESRTNAKTAVSSRQTAQQAPARPAAAPAIVPAATVPAQRNTWMEPAPPEERVEPPVAALSATPPAPVASRPAPRAGLTLVEAQPLLSQLFQQMESGRGDRLLGLMDAEARNKPAAQAFSRQFDSLVDGARSVRLSHVEFKAEPGDGRLYVVGHVRLQAGEQTIGSMGKKMNLRAEFVSRQGTVVLTGLSGGPSN